MQIQPSSPLYVTKYMIDPGMFCGVLYPYVFHESATPISATNGTSGITRFNAASIDSFTIACT